MNKKILGIFVAVLAVAMFAVPVMALKPISRVSAIGHCVTDFDYLGSGTDHSCFINLHATETADGWRGNGVFYDTDYADGKLVAEFVVTSADDYRLYNQTILYGSADVYINDVFEGTYEFAAIVKYAPTWYDNVEYGEVFSFQIPAIPFYAFVWLDTTGISFNYVEC